MKIIKNKNSTLDKLMKKDKQNKYQKVIERII